MLLEVQNLTKTFGGVCANDNVSLNIGRNQIVGLIGPNGAGKSTFFKSILGYNRIDTGKINFLGEDISNFPTHKINKLGIASTFQNAQLFRGLSLGESVLVGAYCHEKNKQRALSISREMLAFVGLSGKEQTPISKLNMFERKNAELAAALATRPKLLLLDELFAGLVQNEVNLMLEKIYQIRSNYDVAIFIIEHVLKVIMTICEKVYVLNYGELISAGSPSEVSSDPGVITAYLGDDYGYTGN